MKKIITLICLALISASAFAGFPSVYTPQVDPNTTNTVIVDCRGFTGLSAIASGQGVSYYLDTITLTNNPGGNTNFVGINYNGTNTVYTWTNSAGLTAQVAVNPATQITVGVRGDAGTASNVLALILGTSTNLYLLTNAPTGAQIQATNDAPTQATNVFSFLQTNYPSFTLAWSGPTNFTLTTATNDNCSISNSITFSNLVAQTTVYLATNTVATNLYFVQPGTGTNQSATNLASVIKRDYPSIQTTVAGAKVTLASYVNNLILTNSAGGGVTNYAFSTQSTNTANGTNIITAAVSGDRVSWYSFPSLNFNLPILSTATIAGTNIVSLGGWPFVQFTIGSVATNGAMPSFTLTATGQ